MCIYVCVHVYMNVYVFICQVYMIHVCYMYVCIDLFFKNKAESTTGRHPTATSSSHKCADSLTHSRVCSHTLPINNVFKGGWRWSHGPVCIFGPGGELCWCQCAPDKFPDRMTYKEEGFSSAHGFGGVRPPWWKQLSWHHGGPKREKTKGDRPRSGQLSPFPCGSPGGGATHT